MKDIRVKPSTLRADRRDALIEWVRSLGVNPNDVRDSLVIVQGEQEFELHLSRYRRNENGKQVVDIAANDVVSEPVVIGIGTSESWPDLTGGIVE